MTDQGNLLVTYDADGLRSWNYYGFAGGDSYSLFDGSQSVFEADSTGNELSFTLYGADGLAGRQTASYGYFAETYDPQGSVVEAVNLGPSNAPRVPLVSAYDAFGLSHAQTANTFRSGDAYDPVGFGGQFGYYHDYHGRYLLGHRYYDAYAGRFVTREPIGYKGGINLYGYTGNNPVNESDPSGFWSLYKAIYTGDPNASDDVYNAALNQGAEGLTRWGTHFKQNNIKSFYLILGTTGIAGYPSLPASHMSEGSELNSSRPGSRILSSQARKMSIRLGQNATKKTIARNFVRGVMKNEAQVIKRTLVRNGLRAGAARLGVRTGIGGVALYEAGVGIYSAKQAWDEEKEAPPAKGDDEP